MPPRASSSRGSTASTSAITSSTRKASTRWTRSTQLRQYFETSEWTPMVRERERKTGETTDVMVKLVNGEPHGMFILTAEPKELTIVLILGPIRMDNWAS